MIFKNNKPVSLVLKDKAANVLSVFQKTIDELTVVNSQALEEKNRKTETIKEAEQEVFSLDVLIQDNSKVIGKINKILN